MATAVKEMKEPKYTVLFLLYLALRNLNFQFNMVAQISPDKPRLKQLKMKGIWRVIYSIKEVNLTQAGKSITGKTKLSKDRKSFK